MPFACRVVQSRADIEDVYGDARTNVLQKSNVSNMIGLLTQMNQISQFASEIFADILESTNSTRLRLQKCKQRVSNLQSTLPEVEAMFVKNAPSFFYDNPYLDKEYSRNDPLNGLLFSRECATKVVNQRRNTAKPPLDLSQLDHISNSGPCIKKFTDSDFFINEWLENEKRKREEEKQRIRANKVKRKKGKVKRKNPKTIQRLKKKRYDALGNEILDTEETEIVVVNQYQLIDDSHRTQNPQKITKVPPQRTKPKAVAPPPVPSTAMAAKVPSMGKCPKVPPPNPLMTNNVGPPPPNPLQLQQTQSQKVREKLKRLSAEIPLDGLDYEIPDDALSPPEIYAKNYQNRDINNEVLDISSAAKIMTSAPNGLKPVPPKLNFLGDITAFKDNGNKLKQIQPNVNRQQSKDKRTLLLTQLKNNKINLKDVKLRKVEPKKEEKKNLIFEAMKDRRVFMDDSEDEDEESSDWGSDSL